MNSFILCFFNSDRIHREMRMNRGELPNATFFLLYFFIIFLLFRIIYLFHSVLINFRIVNYYFLSYNSMIYTRNLIDFFLK